MTSSTKLDWNNNPQYSWLRIIDGLIVRKITGGLLSLVFNDSADPRHLNYYFGSLVEKNSGIITPIFPPMYNVVINLDPKNHYLLVISQTYTKVNGGFVSDTITLEFEPE